MATPPIAPAPTPAPPGYNYNPVVSPWSQGAAAQTINNTPAQSTPQYMSPVINNPVSQPLPQPAPVQKQPTNNPTPNPTPQNSLPNQVTQVAGNPNPNLDPMFQPAIDALEQSIGASTQSELSQEGQLNANLQGNLGTLGTQLSGQMGQLSGQANTLQSQTANAKAEARRGAAEIQQGIQARYGGTTGTGAFASELSGRQANQTVGNLNQNMINGLQAVDTARNQAQSIHDAAVQDLTTKTQAAIRSAQSDLNSRIVQIRGDQANLQGQKASLTQQAIQHYQDTVNQINQFNAQFAQNLAVAHQYAQDMIGKYQTNLAGTAPPPTQVPDPNLQTPVGMQQNPTDQLMSQTLLPFYGQQTNKNPNTGLGM